jgi:hypothetical protein
MNEARLLRILQLVYQGLMLIARGLKREIDELKEKEKQTSDSLR